MFKPIPALDRLTSAVTRACVGYLETDGVKHYLNVTEKGNMKRRKILLDTARPVLAYEASKGTSLNIAVVWAPERAYHSPDRVSCLINIAIPRSVALNVPFGRPLIW